MIINQVAIDQITIPIWLLVLVAILVVVGIIGAAYKIITYRKIHVVAKKIDYLVEDIIYKVEFLTPSIEAISKVSSYIDLFEGIVKKNSESLMNYVVNNKESVFKFSKQLKEVIRERK